MTLLILTLHSLFPTSLFDFPPSAVNDCYSVLFSLVEYMVKVLVSVCRYDFP